MFKPKSPAEVAGMIHDTLIDMGVDRDEFYYVGPDSDDEFTIEVYSGPLGRMVIEVFCDMSVDICTDSNEFVEKVKLFCPNKVTS